MRRYPLYNTLLGWAVFLAAAGVYLATKEPSASFWDCSEQIVASYKLEVPHPPGSPFYMLMGNFFTQLAGGDGASAAVMVNAMSALAGAFTILLLFWSITHLARRLLLRANATPGPGEGLAMLGSGLIGALAFTFTDSFWFVTVEADVYALSSMFTALVFWAMLRWEAAAGQPHANRWLILIAYIMGLSIGVHLLNLLTIPALVFIYYFRRYPLTRRGFLLTLALAIGLLGAMYAIIPGSIWLAAHMDLALVNGLGMPFNSGIIAFLLIAGVGLSLAIRHTARRRMIPLNTLLLAVAVILIGYSSYALLVIRAQANPPMNQNNPSTAFALLHYLNREQYGDRPLLRGQYYNAPVTGSHIQETFIRRGDRYERSYLKTIFEFDERFTTVFPRMWSHREEHIEQYKAWGAVTGRPLRITAPDGHSELHQVPTFGENLRFFFTYQLGFMYWRYFMWNFAGRQNDVQGHGDLLNGNWISGIKPLDAIRLGNQDYLTPAMRGNPTRNTYFLIPLILGLIGLTFQLTRDTKNFWVVTLLFVMTGIAIVVYLNQTPLQPRERDYSYLGSFYAFAMWIGLAPLALFHRLQNQLRPLLAALLAILLTVPGPALLAAQNWDDHDRSGRYIARDFAFNYLMSCAPNAILFTHGDNDTFPLWYAQEVQGVRPDVRVVNLSLLGTDWFIQQMKRKVNQSAPLPISLSPEQYAPGVREIVYILDRIAQPVELGPLMDFVGSDREETRLRTHSGELIDFLPTRHLRLTVDRDQVLRQGVVGPQDAPLIVDTMRWAIGRDFITKSELMVLEIIANNRWERPIYFVSPGSDSDVGLTDYMQLEGFAYRLVPIKTPPQDFLSVGRLDLDRMYQNLMHTFRWGGMDDPDVHIDHNIQRTTLVLRLRHNFNRLAQGLLEAGRRDSALAVITRIEELMPGCRFPYDFFVLHQAEILYELHQHERANSLLTRYKERTVDMLQYLASLRGHHAAVTRHERELNLQILQEMAALAEKHGQADLRRSVERQLNRYSQYLQPAPDAQPF